MHYLVITLLITLAGVLSAMPDLSEIGADDFHKRKVATAKLKSWAVAHSEEASKQLPALYFSSKDPEIRSRILWILKEIRITLPKSSLGLSYKSQKMKTKKDHKSLVVKKLQSGGPAESGGLNLGDQIISVDGATFTANMSNTEINRMLSSLNAGTKTAFTVLRDDKKLTFMIRPKEREIKPEDRLKAHNEFEHWLKQQE